MPSLSVETVEIWIASENHRFQITESHLAFVCIWNVVVKQIVDCNVAQYRMLLEAIIFKIIKYKLYTTWQYLDKVGTHMIFIVGGLCSVCVMNIAGKLTGWSKVGKEGRGMGGLQLFPPRKHFQASAVSCYQVVSILCQLRWLDNCQNFILSPLAPEWCLRWQWPVSITNLISS